MRLAVSLIKKEFGVSNSRLLPSQAPLTILSSYFYQKNITSLNDLGEDDVKNITKWFILASFNGYYSSATDTKLDGDLNTVKSSTSFPIDELLGNMKTRKAKTKIMQGDVNRGLLMNVLRREGRAHLFLLYILLVKKEADNWNGKLLSQSSLLELAKHHIFPKEFLERELNIDDPDDRGIHINNLGNLTFIHKDSFGTTNSPNSFFMSDTANLIAVSHPPKMLLISVVAKLEIFLILALNWVTFEIWVCFKPKFEKANLITG